MYCNVCGAFISDENARFCHNCGSQLTGGNMQQNEVGYNGFPADVQGENMNNGYPADIQGENMYNDYPAAMPQTNNYDNFQPQMQGGFNQYDNQPVQQTNVPDNGKKRTVILAVTAVLSVAVICVLVIVAFYLNSARNGTDIYADLLAGVRAQVTDVPDTDYLQMHDGPSSEAEMTIKIAEGEYVDILNDYNDENEGYIFVRYLNGDNYTDGWVLGEYLVKICMTDDYKSLEKDAICRTLRESAESEGVMVYKESNRKSDILIEVPESDYVKVLKSYDEQDGEFIFVEYNQGENTYEGWVNGKYLVFVRMADEPEEETSEIETTEPTKAAVKFERGDVCVIGTNTPYHDGVTLRSQASFNSPAVRVIAEGEYVIVTADYHESNNGYVQCFYDDGVDMKNGWIKDRFLVYVAHWNGDIQHYYNAVGGYPSQKDTTTTFYEGGPGSDAYKDFEEGDWCYVGFETVGHDGLNLRSGPSSKSNLIMTVGEGTDAYVIKDYSSSDNGYVKVEVYGRTGYLIGKYLVFSRSEPDTEPDTEPETKTQVETTTESTTEETTTETTTTETTTETTTTEPITEPTTEPTTEATTTTQAEPVIETEEPILQQDAGEVVAEDF